MGTKKFRSKPVTEEAMEEDADHTFIGGVEPLHAVMGHTAQPITLNIHIHMPEPVHNHAHYTRTSDSLTTRHNTGIDDTDLNRLNDMHTNTHTNTPVMVSDGAGADSVRRQLFLLAVAEINVRSIPHYSSLCQMMNMAVPSQQDIDAYLAADTEDLLSKFKDAATEAVAPAAPEGKPELEAVDVDPLAKAPWDNETDMMKTLDGWGPTKDRKGKTVRAKRKFHTGGNDTDENDDGFIEGEYLGAAPHPDTGRLCFRVKRMVGRKTKSTEVLPETIRLAPEPPPAK